MSAAPADAGEAPEWTRAHLRPGEHVIWWGHPSLWGILPAAASTAVALVGTILGFTVVPPRQSGGSALTIPLVLAVLGLGSRFVERVVKIRFTAYLVTDQRFYAITSFLTSTAQSVPFSRFSKVSLRQGFFERLVGLWTAHVTSYGEAGASLEVPAMRDGERLLEESSNGLLRGANPAWLFRGD